MRNSATTASAPPSIARAETPRCSRSPTWCGRSRPAATCCRRPPWRTCTAPIVSVAPEPERSRSRRRDECEMTKTSHNSVPSPLRKQGPITPASIIGCGVWVPARRPPKRVEDARSLGRDDSEECVHAKRKLVRRGLRATLIAAPIGVVCLFAAFAGWIVSLGPPPLGDGLAFSTLVVDRDGRLLRPYTTNQGRWRLPASPEDVDPRFFNLLFAYEDKRFLAHHGVDPLALGRALGQLVGNGHIV